VHGGSLVEEYATTAAGRGWNSSARITMPFEPPSRNGEADIHRYIRAMILWLVVKYPTIKTFGGNVNWSSDGDQSLHS